MFGAARCVLIVFILFLSISHAHSNSKIVNGTDALPGEYPYAVSVRYFDSHECGGSIIGPKWILTAAHCVYASLVNNASILYGTTYLQNGQKVENHTAQVTSLFQHELYAPTSPSYENDIGLIELKEPLIFNDFVQPVPLAESFYGTPSAKGATLVGWGYNETDGYVMETLQKVELTIYSDSDCYQVHDGLALPTAHICAGYPNGGKGQCTGDSGGPLTVNGIQYGTVSWSVKPCGIVGFPGVFARVSTYREWIYDKSGI